MQGNDIKGKPIGTKIIDILVSNKVAVGANQFEVPQLLCTYGTKLAHARKLNLGAEANLAFDIFAPLGLKACTGRGSEDSKTEHFFFPPLGCFKPNVVSNPSPVKYSNLVKIIRDK